MEMVIEAEKREHLGKNESRRLRREGRIPAIVYGGGADKASLSLDPRDVMAILHSEAGENTLFDLKVSGGVQKGKFMIKSHQVDPVTDNLVHADIMRIAMDKVIRVHVAVHAAGVAAGVRLQGGILDHPLREVELECLPTDIPERIEIDITELELGNSLRVSDLTVPESVKILTDEHMPVVSVIAPTIEKVEEPAEGEIEGEAPTEPELIKTGKADEEGESPDSGGEKSEK